MSPSVLNAFYSTHRLHYAVFRPRMAAPRVEFLVLRLGRVVNRLGIEGGVDISQKRNDVRIGIADALHFEEILVDVDDVELVFPDTDLAEIAQLAARALDEFQSGGEVAGFVNVSGEWCGHGMKKAHGCGPWAWSNQ